MRLKKHRSSALVLGAALAIGNPAFAASENLQYSIPAGSLASALNRLAETAGLQLVYEAGIAEGLQSKGLNGRFSNEVALEQLLSNSGLAYRLAENGQVLIEKQARSVSQEPAALEAVNVVAKTPIASQDPYNPDYRVTNASTALKTDTPILETPYAVTVVPQQVLKDQQVIRIEDGIKNVAGVQSSWTNGGTSDVFMMRGFQNTNTYRDGFLQPSALGGGTTKRETANLQQIEVLKGPGSILFGRNEPGGLVNLVTKRPQAKSYNAIQQQFGSYDFYRTTADSTGAITADDKLLYRVNLSYENAGSFRDFVKTDSVFIAPSFTWNISDKTQANLDVEYQHFDNTSDSGGVPIGNRPAPVPINRQLGDPTNNKSIGDRTYVGANWSHSFNDKWKLNHRFGAEFLDQAADFTFFYGQATPEGDLYNLDNDWNGNRGFNNALSHQQNYYTTLNLSGKFDTAMLEHSTMVGFDYFVIDNQDFGACCSAYPSGVAFNIFKPSYLSSRPADVFAPSADFTQDWYGVYFQDQIKFPFNVYGNFGVRYDNASSRNNLASVQSTDDRVSPRGGLLWKPVEWLSVYGNYSENFGPSNSMWNAPGQKILRPQTAEQWELGAKTEFFDGRLSTTFGYFDLSKQSIAVSDPTNPMLQITSGEQQSRGYEFEVAGEVLPGWRTIAAYTHLAYANINVGWNGGVDDDTGHRLYNAPRNFGSIWNTYEFQNGQLRGLKLGGGVVASEQSQGSNDNSFQLPGYATVNLLASYGMKVVGKQVTLQLNANNLLDKTYYTGTNTGSMIGFGAPRTFLGSVKVEF